MNLEKVVFGFFVVLALTLNLGFVVGEIDNPAHHDVIEFFLVIIVNIIVHVWESGMTPETMVIIVSLAGGALLANVISVTIVVAETLMLRR
jgi:hypothetical protein